MSSYPTVAIPKIDWTLAYKIFFPEMLTLWPLWFLLGITVVAIAVFYFYQYQRLSRAGMLEVDKMTGSEFEERLAILFRNLGYNVERTGRVGDYGVDLVIEKSGIRTAVQAKCYKSGKVHPDAVQQVYAGKNKHSCTEAMVVSNRNYTIETWRLARSDNVKLWSRNYLVKVLLTEKSLKQ